MNIKNKTKILLNQFISGAKSPIILGGHFALANDPKNTKSLIPAIFQDCEDEEVSNWMKKHPYMSYFPSETFSMSVDLLKENNDARLLLLVNDLQQVKGTEVLKNELRSSFYLENKLPNLFKSLANKKNVNLTNKILNSPNKFSYKNSYYWSERMLRRRFSRDSVYKTCSLKGDCAKEFTPLLYSCETIQVDKMIAMIPATCAYPILEAVNEFRNVYDGKMDIMTVFFTNSLSLEKFWNVSIFLNGKET